MPETARQPVPAHPHHGAQSLLALAVISLLAGAVTGGVCAGFRVALEQADDLRDRSVVWAQGNGAIGVIAVVAACAAACAVAVWLVQHYSPHAAGSGIPHVEGVLEGRLPPAGVPLVIVKFIGGLLAIGSGLALGREGPSVQIGATLSHLIGRVFHRAEADGRVLLAAGAGAGLATAFNAPIAGVVFVLEELVRRFDLRTTIAALGASAAAIGVGRTILGPAPDFPIAALPDPELGLVPYFIALGALCGLVGVGYNKAILGALHAAAGMSRVPAALRGAAIGGAVGLVACFFPAAIGGGDALTQRALTGTDSLMWLPLLFAFRFVLGPVSYAAGTPGGLFAPMLVLGAQLGLGTAAAANRLFPGSGLNPIACAVVGMAAFFTAVVRAPLTGIILVLELTGTSTLLLPMLAACCAAMLIPTLLRQPAIYESLQIVPGRSEAGS